MQRQVTAAAANPAVLNAQLAAAAAARLPGKLKLHVYLINSR